MSSKINIYDIISGHISTLKKPDSDSLNKIDIITFYGIPLLFSIFGILKDFDLDKDLTSLLVNFGSIFTALLLSVLVLIYDQENKLDDKRSMIEKANKANNKFEEIPFYEEKKQILSELYFTICYCVIGSMALVFVAAINSVIKTDEVTIAIKFLSFKFDFNTDVFTPLCVYIAINLILTIVMIVKRMHVLLTTEN
jgi:hypothetical protein